MRLPQSVSVVVAAVFSSSLLGGVQAAGSNSTHELTGFPPCDALINAGLSHAVHLATSPSYETLVKNGSWALDTQKEPWCFVLPETSEEVSRTIVALKEAGKGAGDWHIAVRSGGHGSDNSNNIALGVTIDLTNLNGTVYDESTNIASIGTGARWGAAYTELEESGVLVPGGREAVVGVGGLTLGGGISWYLAKRGFTCDSVVNYEVVLSTGEIINANSTSNSDLCRALKGGSGNFGIVTRFDFEAFPASNLSIQRTVMSLNESEKIIDGVATFTDMDQSHADNAMIGIITYDPDLQDSIFTLTTVNTMDDANSTAFDMFKGIPAMQTGEKQSLSLSKSSDRSQVQSNSLGVGSGAMVIPNDRRVMRYCIEQQYKLVEDLKKSLGPENFRTILDLQPFPSYVAQHGVAKGGNMLGVERNPNNRIFFVSSVLLEGKDRESHYPRVLQQVTAMNERISAFAKTIEDSAPFTYLAYARARQNPLESYGEANLRYMKQVAKKYDPCGFFQRRVPGGFKLDRAG